MPSTIACILQVLHAFEVSLLAQSFVDRILPLSQVTHGLPDMANEILNRDCHSMLHR